MTTLRTEAHPPRRLRKKATFKNELELKDALPETPITTFETVDDGLADVKSPPDTERFIFLDIKFDGKTAWDFLNEYKR